MRFNLACGLLTGALLGPTTALRTGHLTSLAFQDQVQQAKRHEHLAKREDYPPTLLYPAHNLSVPIDFFPDNPRYEPHTNDTFPLRYWFDATYYKPGGPVFVLLAGETSGVGRLTFLQKGIVHQVIEATGGLGVILEHRYYGTSWPVDDLSVESLRFLSTEQSLAEIDYFARNVQFEGIDADLTAPNTPWIVYGGSYAGAQAAFMRVKYPDTFWGAISSSGVTVAIYDYWEYFEPIVQFAPPDVIKNTQLMIDVVDKHLFSNDTSKVKAVKSAFGLGNITHNGDFASVLMNGIYGWQSTNWDPAITGSGFWNYQNNMTDTLNFDATDAQRETVKDLLTFAGYEATESLESALLNAINYFEITSVSRWRRSGRTQDQYYTSLNAEAYQDESLDPSGGRCWNYQVCTEWGYIQTGDVPEDAGYMPIVSKAVDLDYSTFFCRAAFNITSPPNVTEVNQYGGFDISYPRLAIIGGNADPWKPATPLADDAEPRESTTEEPVLEIAHGVHHWEENGIFPNETTPILPPNQVVYAQQFLKNFVIEWLKEWDGQYKKEL